MFPPTGKIHIRAPREDGQPTPGEDLEPDLSGEGAAGQDVLDAAELLVTKQARIIVREVVTRKPGRRPAAVKGSEPEEPLHPERCPRFPDGAPMGVTDGASKHLLVEGLGQVVARVGPAPTDRVWGV